MYADVANYCRLTGVDEDGAHAHLSEYLDAIGRHRGVVAHHAGDAVLARFDTPSEAVFCALGIQRLIRDRNAGLPRGRRVEFRIGINIGDVIADRDDLYGDAANVTARPQSLAEPSGICVSEAVRTAMCSAAPVEYRFIDARRVKNIARPIRAYRLCEPCGSPPGGSMGRDIAVLWRFARGVLGIIVRAAVTAS